MLKSTILNVVKDLERFVKVCDRLFNDKLSRTLIGLS